MYCYLYDNTFTGLLTAIYYVLKSGETVDNLMSTARFQPDLFTRPYRIESNAGLVKALFHDLAGRVTKQSWQDLYLCFLSEEVGMEMAILDFIKKSLYYQGVFASKFTDNTVMKIHSTSCRVAHEVHRMQGFIRFRKMSDGIYYAPVEPDYNILPLLAPHFTARFADQKWFIHDLQRQKGLYYDGWKCVPVSSVVVKSPPSGHAAWLNSSVVGTDEFQYQELWDEYFQRIAIDERENKRQQRQCMPRRYWKHLIERVEE